MPSPITLRAKRGVRQTAAMRKTTGTAKSSGDPRDAVDTAGADTMPIMPAVEWSATPRAAASKAPIMAEPLPTAPAAPIRPNHELCRIHGASPFPLPPERSAASLPEQTGTGAAQRERHHMSTYEGDDPTSEIPPDEPHNVRINALHGAAQNAAQSLVTPFLGIDLIRLGGTDLEIGLLNALPPLATTLSTLLGARWVGARRHARTLTTLLFMAARAAFLALAVVNLLPHRWAALTLVAIIGLMNVPQAISLVSWQAIITGLLRPTIRGPAMATRTMLASLFGIVAVLLGGWWIARAPGVSGYPELDVAACLLAGLEIFLFTRLRGDPPVQTLPPHLLQASRRLWKRRRFRRHIIATLPFYLGWMMAWPLILRYQVDVAHANNLWIALYTATNALSAAVTSRWWGRIGTRIGPRLALPLSIFGLSFVPLVYWFHPGPPGILVAEMLGGGMGAGVNMMLLLRLMEVTPSGDRILGMGVANTLMGVAGLAGPLLGTALAVVVPIPAVFVIPFLLRLSGAGALYAAQRSRQRTAWGWTLPF